MKTYFFFQRDRSIMILMMLLLVYTFLSFEGIQAEEINSNTPQVQVPQFCSVINKNGNPFLNTFQTELKNNRDFIEIYEEVKTTYHEQTNTQFNTEIEKLISGFSKGAENMCIPFEYEISTHPLRVSYEVMNRIEQYECALLEYIKNPPPSIQPSYQIQEIKRLSTLSSELQEEIIKSYQSLEITLMMYAEMRRWYPVHRDLQCLISQLEIYRDALRKFIDQIARMPAKFYNYGSSYQY